MKKPEKLAAAVELGRRGGLRGGVIRAQRLSPERRSEIARRAAKARWANHETPPALKSQISEGYAAYLRGNYRSIEEFMDELKKELKEHGEVND